MKPKLILMFTQNDVTVPDAIDYFEKVKDLPVDYFGFKEIGLPHDKMKELNNKIHAAGVKSFLEVVEYDEESIKEPAKMALDLGFDYLMGTVYFPSIWDIIDKKIKYFPFCGKIYDRPSVLDGTIDEIVADAKRIEKAGANGFDLLAYRYKYPDKINDLVLAVRDAVDVPIVSAGSINSFDRLQETIDQGVWGFTIGGAFFEKKFVPDGTYRDNVEAVIEKLK
jgi:2,4-dienoyl-CoA reductase-like NADH-dependent reductase (Old Yellow Enzyme family)